MAISVFAMAKSVFAMAKSIFATAKSIFAVAKVSSKHQKYFCQDSGINR